MSDTISGVPGYCPSGASLLAASDEGGLRGMSNALRLLEGPVRGRGQHTIDGANAAKRLIVDLLHARSTADEFDAQATAACAGASSVFVRGFTGTVTGAAMSLNAPSL